MKQHSAWLRCVTMLVSLVVISTVAHAESPDLSSIPADLVVPAAETTVPAPGKRVRQTTTGWEGTDVHHTLYLPRDWKKDTLHPVIVEYPGNGGYKNKFGDVSEGIVEGCHMGYGLSGGEHFIWVSMPYVEIKDGRKQSCALWWGDVEETKRYCLATMREVCAKYGGDTKRIVLAGFSRGAIGCNFIGLHDDEICKLWCGFFCHSHHDGVIERWPYAGKDRASAMIRLQRLQGRPQWISHEERVDETRRYLEQSGIKGDFTFVPLPFRNHSDQWLLRDIPERRKAREWLARVIK